MKPEKKSEKSIIEILLFPVLWLFNVHDLNDETTSDKSTKKTSKNVFKTTIQILTIGIINPYDTLKQNAKNCLVVVLVILFCTFLSIKNNLRTYYIASEHSLNYIEKSLNRKYYSLTILLQSAPESLSRQKVIQLLKLKEAYFQSQTVNQKITAINTLETQLNQLPKNTFLNLAKQSTAGKNYALTVNTTHKNLKQKINSYNENVAFYNHHITKTPQRYIAQKLHYYPIKPLQEIIR